MKKTTLILLGFIFLPIIGFGQGIDAATYPTQGIKYPGNGITYFGLNTTTDNAGTTSFGDSAGSSISGTNNTFMGSFAGTVNEGSNNVFTGFGAGFYHGYGGSNVYSGYKSGYNSFSSAGNVYVGNLSGYGYVGTYSSGSNNVLIGNQTGRNVTMASNTTCIGAFAGYNGSGNNNVFIGCYAGFNERTSNRLYINNSSTTIPLIFGKFKNTQGSIQEENQVGINTNNIPSGFTFAVGGKAICEEVKVAMRINGIWPDYVFNNEYRLPSLKEVEKHIKENGHLKNIPSAAEVSENGLFLGEMNAKLLQKIEELTLYAIQQQKELEQQKEKNSNLEERLKKLEFLSSNKK